MNDRVVLCAALLTSLTLVQSAGAQPRRTIEATTLRKKPGEKEAVVSELAAGTEVQVLSVQGRWLRVRVKNVEGFITRTTVTDPDAPAVVDTRAWSASRTAGEGEARTTAPRREVTDLYVQITAPSSILRAAPDGKAAKVTELPQGTRLVVVDAAKHPQWISVRDDQGHEGWLARDQVDNTATSVTVTGVDLKGPTTLRETFTRRPTRRVALRADLGFGFRSLGMDLTSNSTGGLTNYLVDADAAALTLDLQGVLRARRRWFLAADARVQLSQSSPGIDYPGPTSAAGKIPFKTGAVDVAARAGLRVQQVLDLSLGAGLHYDAFLPDNVDNAGMLPRERLLGATLGARAEIAPLRSRFSACVRFDALLLGSRAQTPGLEDGTSNTAHGWWGGVTLRYVLTSHLAAFLAYDFARATTEWNGMSVRQAGVTNTSRADTAQLAQLGLTAEL